MRIAEVLDEESKAAFYSDVRESLDLSRRAANICIRECFTADTKLMTVGEKAPKFYTYPKVSGMFPGCTMIAAAISRTAEKHYKTHRWKIARGMVSVPNQRSFPWPLLHNKSVKMLKLNVRDEFITASIQLTGKRWTVRLKGGSNYRDQIAGIKAAVENGTIGDSKLWVDRKHRAVIGICCDVPAKDERKGTGTVSVVTHRDHFLIGTSPRSDVPFAINGDRVRQWNAERNRVYQRCRQDRKQDKHWRRAANERMERLSQKHRDRIKTFCHEASCEVVKFAKRRKAAKVEFDSTIRSYVPSFPWFEFIEMVKYKCEDAGFEFVDRTLAIAEPNIDKPHVYFKYYPTTKYVKIGQTRNAEQRAKAASTDTPENVIYLALSNAAKTKLRAEEKRWHGIFASHRVRNDREFFDAGPVIQYLEEAQMIGNAGNMTQIKQVLDASDDVTPESPESLAND